jgi:hypothetical protein
MWFYTTIAFAVLSLILGVVLTGRSRESSTNDSRLIGTWMSDKERTIEMMAASTDKEGEAFHKLATLLGRMKVHYSKETIYIEMDGKIDSSAYEVLGTDRHSCVIKIAIDDDTKIDAEIDDILKISSFSTVHFADANTYWVTSQFGGFHEYFKRVLKPT